MNDDLDLRLSSAFRSLDLPGADPRLRDTLEALRKRGATRPARNGSHPSLTLLAAAASIVVAVALVISQLGIVRFGPGPSPTPEPTPPPSPTPSPTPLATTEAWTAYTVATLLTARAAGDVGAEQVLVVGWWTDLRPDTLCGTPAPSPLLIGCGDGQFGLTDAETPIGRWNGDVFFPTDGPALTPLLLPGEPTPGLGRDLIGLVDELGNPHPPVLTTMVGRFDTPEAEACPAALRQACRDRFVVDEIIWAEAGPRPTPNPSPLVPDPDDPPPTTFPSLLTTCRTLPPEVAEPGDTTQFELASDGWVRFEELDLQPLTRELLTLSTPVWIYVVVTEPDAPLSKWRPDPAGSDRTFRWMGQRMCIGWSESSGVYHSTVPGSTYELWSDGERVPVEVFPPEP
jgi:hypothetical protein